MKRIFYVCVVFFLLFPAISVSGEQKSSETEALAKIKKQFLADYRIGCGDILQITTWKEPDFTFEEVLVRIDGKITFPLINDIQAEGRTPMELKGVIEKGLSDYIDAPVVTVTVRSPASQRFYILGEVVRIGEYPLTKKLTILQAFTLAGGFTEWASKKEILLLRHEDGKDKIIRIDYKNIIKGKDLGMNVFLKADDTIIVP